MRRKIKHSSRYKDYPKNVPKRLLKEFFQCNRLVTKLSYAVNVNTGVISALLNDGREPQDIVTRVRLYLKPERICRACGHKVRFGVAHKKTSKPDFIVKWNHLSTNERHKVIQTYMDWKVSNDTIKGDNHGSQE